MYRKKTWSNSAGRQHQSEQAKTEKTEGDWQASSCPVLFINKQHLVSAFIKPMNKCANDMENTPFSPNEIQKEN